MKIADLFVIVISVAVCVGAGYYAYGEKHSEAQIQIKGSEKIWVFPQDAEESITVAGPLGDTIVQIHKGQVRVLSSPCANQTCVAGGHIDKRGQWLACLPNNVFVSIQGGDKEGLDATTW